MSLHRTDDPTFNRSADRSSAQGDGGHAGSRRGWGPFPEEGPDMTVGPVQLIVLGFNHPNVQGEVKAQLESLRAVDAIRVIDSLAVYKDAAGKIEIERLSNLTQDESMELGSVVGALVGLGAGGEEGAIVGALAGAEAGSHGVSVFTDEEAWDV